MNFIDEIELTKVVSKLEFFINEEQLTISSLKDIFACISGTYSTPNKNDLIEQTNYLLTKADVISDTHYDYIAILNKNITKYIDVAKSIETQFEDLEY